MIRVTRLPGPTAREEEEQVAEYIEDEIARCDGRNLGTRTRRDGDAGLRVDFTYDSATPPVAMEITALVQPAVRALGAELLKLEARLQQVVRTESLGGWMLGIREGTNVREIEGRLIELLRRHRGRRGVVVYSADNPPGDLTGDDLVLVSELSGMGVVTAMYSDQDNELSIFPPISDMTGTDGFGALIDGAMAANVDKLREARPRETHLVVTLDRSDLGVDPASTPAPALLDGIDFFWVVLGYFNAKWTYRLWRTRAGDRHWLLLRHPLGNAPIIHPRVGHDD